MKNTRLIVMIFAFASIISCSKDESNDGLIITQENEQHFIDGVVVKNGTLHFESGDKFFYCCPVKTKWP